ncbi:hypothetical protein [Peribacillus frigoritolerans]|uniref:hypothetical protein n=1 Tax=Peribacillus frigoritolerans TaxID=450367 RepID=UPI003EB904EC
MFQELLSESYFVCSADVDQFTDGYGIYHRESWYKQIFLVYLPAGIINTAKQLLLQEVVVWLLWIASKILVQG